MTAISTASFPSSFQLRLAFTDRRTTAVIFLRRRVHKVGRLVRLTSVAQNNRVIKCNGMEVRRSGDSWVVNSNSKSSADGFAGWNEDEKAPDSHRKQPLTEIIGAGLAGGLLVAGIVYVALSIGRRSRSRLDVQMQPLISQPEMSEASTDQENVFEVGNDERKNSTEHSTTDTEKEASSSIESNEASESNYRGNDTDYKPSNAEDPDLASSENFPSDVTCNDLSFASEDFSEKQNFQEGNSLVGSSSEEKDAHVPSENPGRLNETEAGQESFSVDAGFENLNHDSQEMIDYKKENEAPNSSSDFLQSEPGTVKISVVSQFHTVLDPKNTPEIDIVNSRNSSSEEKFDLSNVQDISAEGLESLFGLPNTTKPESSGNTSVSDVAYTPADEIIGSLYPNNIETESSFGASNPGNVFTSAGIPAPTAVSSALLAVQGKVLVPAVVDQVQAQALAALQALKVIEADAQPGDICSRREYARWLVSASSALSRSSVSKVYPAMYIENVTELAFDDITAEDPDFSSIQGLAEAGLISSKLSRRDMQAYNDDTGPIYFSASSPLSRQDLVSWKMALERKQLPVVERKKLLEVSGFIDVDKINQDAWPALMADLAAGEQGIIALAFGYTRLFQPDKPVTKSQAAIALTTGESSDFVGEELARIEAESMAEKVVAAQNDLVAQVEEEVNATYEKELQLEREKVGTIEKLAEEARHELDLLKAQREEENLALMKERAAVDSQLEVLTKLRRDLEEQLHTLLSNKVEISYEKERLQKLRKDAEFESQEITRLQHELEVERKALSMARSWAEEEAKRARDQAKALEEARERWSSQGIKVVVDDDLRQEEDAGVTWMDAGKEFSVEKTVGRAENLVDRLKAMANDVSGKSRDIINKIIQSILHFIDILKEWFTKAGQQTGELKDAAISKMNGSLQNVQHASVEYSSALKGGLKRVAEDCRGGVEKITQKFKT